MNWLKSAVLFAAMSGVIFLAYTLQINSDSGYVEPYRHLADASQAGVKSVVISDEELLSYTDLEVWSAAKTIMDDRIAAFRSDLEQILSSDNKAERSANDQELLEDRYQALKNLYDKRLELEANLSKIFSKVSIKDENKNKTKYLYATRLSQIVQIIQDLGGLRREGYIFKHCHTKTVGVAIPAVTTLIKDVTPTLEDVGDITTTVVADDDTDVEEKDDDEDLLKLKKDYKKIKKLTTKYLWNLEKAYRPKLGSSYGLGASSLFPDLFSGGNFSGNYGFNRMMQDSLDVNLKLAERFNQIFLANIPSLTAPIHNNVWQIDHTYNNYYGRYKTSGYGLGRGGLDDYSWVKSNDSYSWQDEVARDAANSPYANWSAQQLSDKFNLYRRDIPKYQRFNIESSGSLIFDGVSFSADYL